MRIKSVLRLSTISAGIVLGLALTGASAKAGTVRSVLSDNIGSDPASVGVNLDQIGGNIQFTIEVLTEPNTGNIGDLLGFFFDFGGDDSLLPGLSVINESCTTASGGTFNNSSGSPCVSNVTFDASNVINFGGGNNLNPADPFDAGITIGSSGLKGGADDIRKVMFTLTHGQTALSIFQFITPDQRIGARLQSVGPEDSTRAGSSKVVGEVPTPALLPGIVGMGVAAFRKRKQVEEGQEA